MRTTCEHAANMSIMIQVRNVPEPIHRTLKARAALAGKSLSDYILAELERAAALPTEEEIRQRIHERPAAADPQSIAAAVREEREAR